jgi:hypothetical protein
MNGRKTGQQARITTSPPANAGALSLRCQSCDAPLTFIHTIEGGVEPIERWVRYVCRRCGTGYEYRERTRELKRAS